VPCYWVRWPRRPTRSTPAVFNGPELAVGESVTIRKTVTVDESGPTDALIDAHFLIDTSGSMGSQVAVAKAAATALFNSLNDDFGDVSAGVGVFPRPLR
jgi:hypothetical protein